MAKKKELIEGYVVKRNRKYMQVHLNTHTKPDFTQKMLINEASDYLKTGDSFKFHAEIKWGYSYNTGKAFVDYYIPIKEEDFKEEEIERWKGYVINAIHQGYWYDKGAAKLKELGADTDLVELKNLWAKTYKERLIGNIQHYIEHDGRLWKNGITGLRNLGANKEADELVAYYQEEKKKKEEEYVKKAQKEQEEERAKGLYRIPIGAFEAQWYSVGSLYNYNGEVCEVLSKKYQGEDGLSFGAGEEYWYILTVQKLPETDERVIKYRAQEKVEKEQQSVLRELKELQVKLEKPMEKSEYLYKTEDSKTLEAILQEKNLQVLYDNRTIYGGGNLYAYNETTQFLFINNGADGDCWGSNNILTGGAGGYGYERVMTSRPAQYVKRYLELSSVA